MKYNVFSWSGIAVIIGTLSFVAYMFASSHIDGIGGMILVIIPGFLLAFSLGIILMIFGGRDKDVFVSRYRSIFSKSLLIIFVVTILSLFLFVDFGIWEWQPIF
jgi:hypothetical protein